MTKKALPETNEAFVFQRDRRLHRWDFFAEEIVEAVNDSSEGEPVLANLRMWLFRYLEEGTTDDFLNDLNSILSTVKYRKYVLPSDINPSDSSFPNNGYVALLDGRLDPEAYAADDFSKLLTSGQLQRLRLCQLNGCGKFFLGPPQAKWCSKLCGSKNRVKEKRKRDAK